MTDAQVHTGFLNRRMALIAGGALAALAVSFGIGYSVGDDSQALESARIDAASQRLRAATLESENDDLNAELTDVHKVKAMREQVEVERTQLESERTGMEQRVKNSQATLKELDQQIVAAREGLRVETIDSDGVYEVGKDIKAATYKTTTGSSSCYYALLNSTDTTDIATNNLGSTNATITLPSGKFFMTRNCGTWTSQ